MGASGIEWTQRTWNPVVGCTPVSPGCLNCYAATMARRLEAMGRPEYVGLTVRKDENSLEAGGGRGRDVFNGTVRCLDDRLTEPLRWRKPSMVFVNSMSDLFHEAVSFEYIDRVFAVMALCPQHTFQVLTKRPERMAEYLLASGGRLNGRTYERETHVGLTAMGMVFDARVADPESTIGKGILLHRDGEPVKWPLPNVWLGASAERQKELDERVPHLLRCPAAVRFLSCEPLLEALDLNRVGGRREVRAYGDKIAAIPTMPHGGPEPIDHSEFVQWVIVGGESGPNARPCDVGWIRSIVGQCKAAGVACFVKQLGTKPQRGMLGPDEPVRLDDRKGGDPSEWPEDLRVREFPQHRKQ